MLEHLIRDGRELLFLGRRGGECAAQREGERQESKSDDRHEFPRRRDVARAFIDSRYGEELLYHRSTMESGEPFGA